MKNIRAPRNLVLSASTCAATIILLLFACKKQSSLPPAPPAHGSLVNSNGSCMPYAAHGAWYTGTAAGADTSYVEVTVHVTTAGSYTIYTDTVNGGTFTASGNFADTGTTTVRLKSSGTFTQFGYTDFTTHFDSTSCTFRITVRDGTGLAYGDNTWQFTADGRQYKGTCSGMIWDSRGGPGATFNIYGTQQGYADSAFYLYVGYDTYNITDNTYPTSGNAAFSFMPVSKDIDSLSSYQANNNTLPATATIVVKSVTIDYDAYGQAHVIYLGSFDGTARDANNNIVPITKSIFKLVNPKESEIP